MEVYAWSDLVLGSIIVVGPIARDSVLIQTLKPDFKIQTPPPLLFFASLSVLTFLLLLLPIPHFALVILYPLTHSCFSLVYTPSLSLVRITRLRNKR